MGAASSPQHDQRAVRVFVSSTFQDMQNERDELVTRSFQRLRKLCESLGVVWSEIDLRWGITDEERLKDQVLPICLTEIDACRPYFIGILGERYGWECRTLPPELVDRYPWLRVREGASITELEFLHGALNQPAEARRAFFYFRSPAREERASEGERLHHPDLSPAGGQKLLRLKHDVRASGLPLHEGYGDAQQLAERVFADLARAITEDFAGAKPEDAIARDRRQHASYADTRRQIYLPRERDYRRLDAHASSENPPLVVLGPSGVGKSALLANWVGRFRTAHPDQVVIEYYAGASPESTDWRNLVTSVLGQLGITSQGAVGDAEALRTSFSRGLHRAAAAGPCVVVLDALNQLEDKEGALQLAWLPQTLPSTVRLVLSTLEGEVLDECRRRGWGEMSVRALRPAERRRLIALYLQTRYAKHLPPDRVERIARVPLAANPLWLVALLEELRLHGEHETLDRQIEHYLQSRSIEELFALILQRWEDDYDRERPGLVRDSMRLLWAARHGLSDNELRELLGRPDDPLPPLVWSTFHFAADHSLVSRSGLITFFHSYLRRAVEQRYRMAGESRRAAHRELATYFRALDPSSRRIRELPWQLTRSESWEDLERLLSDVEFLQNAWAEDELDVKRYWAELEQRGGRSRVAAYAPVLADPPAFREVADAIGTLLAEAGYRREALPLYERLGDALEREGDWLELGRALTRTARLLDTLGRRAEALAAHARAEQIFRERSDPQDLLVSLGEQAQIRISQGAPDRALSLLVEAEGIATDTGDEDNLQAVLVSRAALLTDRHAYVDAEALLVRAQGICRKLGNSDGLQRAYGYEARLRHSQRRFSEALALIEAKERICTELGDRSGVAGSLNDRAVLLSSMGGTDAGLELLDAAQAIYEEMGSTSGMADTAGNRATIRQKLGDLDEALELYERQERLYREIGELWDLDICLFNQALLHELRKQPERALVLYDQAAAAAGRVGREAAQAVAWSYKARLLASGGEVAAAYELLKEALRRFQALENRWEMATTLRFMADALLSASRHEDAMAAARWAERLGSELDSMWAVASALDRQAEILTAAEQFRDALAVRQREVEARRRVGEDDDLIGTLGQVVQLAWRIGDVSRILAALGDQLDVLTRLGRQSEIRGLLEGAIGTLQAGVDLDEDDRAYLAGLERLRSRVGEADDCAPEEMNVAGTAPPL